MLNSLQHITPRPHPLSNLQILPEAGVLAKPLVTCHIVMNLPAILINHSCLAYVIIHLCTQPPRLLVLQWRCKGFYSKDIFKTTLQSLFIQFRFKIQFWLKEYEFNKKLNKKVLLKLQMLHLYNTSKTTNFESYTTISYDGYTFEIV